MVRKFVVAGALGAVAFLAAGPLQHIGAVPETALGNASKSTIKAALNIGVQEAWGRFGNGGSDGVPGGSRHQDRTR